MITLTEQQISVLGRPNFLCSGVAKILIHCGLYAPGPNKAEYEQAVCIHWTSELLRTHGDNWCAEAKRIIDSLEAAKRQDGE